MGLDPSEAEDHVCEEGAPAWLATMGDLMSLLLVFFVLMLSFANTDKQLFMQAMGSIQNALGLIEDHPGKFQIRSSSMIEWSEKKSTPFLDIMDMEKSNDAPSMDQKIMQKVQQAISENNLSRIVEAESSERGRDRSSQGRALFKAGVGFIAAGFLRFPRRSHSYFLKNFPMSFRSKGIRTTARSIRLAFRPTGIWRPPPSIAVLRYMIDAGDLDPSRISAGGYGSTRPLVPNDSPESRAVKRRVEFVYKRDPVSRSGDPCAASSSSTRNRKSIARRRRLAVELKRLARVKGFIAKGYAQSEREPSMFPSRRFAQAIAA